MVAAVDVTNLTDFDELFIAMNGEAFVVFKVVAVVGTPFEDKNSAWFLVKNAPGLSRLMYLIAEDCLKNLFISWNFS